MLDVPAGELDVKTMKPISSWASTMKRYLVAALILVTTPALAQQSPADIVEPAVGLVSTEETAIRIAVAVWEPIYGKDVIAKQKPYIARKIKRVWLVTGTLPKGAIGGVAEAEISELDGRILRVTHTQ